MPQSDDFDSHVDDTDEARYDPELNSNGDHDADFDPNSDNYTSSYHHDVGYSNNGSEDHAFSAGEITEDNSASDADAKPPRPAWEPYNLDRWLEKRLKQLRANTRVKEERKRLEEKYRKALQEQERRLKEAARLAAEEKKQREHARSHHGREKQDALVATLLLERKDRELKDRAQQQWREAQASLAQARAARKEEERVRAQQLRESALVSATVAREKARRDAAAVREREREAERLAREEKEAEVRRRVRRQWVEATRRRNKKRGLPLNTGIPQEDIDEVDGAKNTKRKMLEGEEEGADEWGGGDADSYHDHYDNGADGDDTADEDEEDEKKGSTSVAVDTSAVVIAVGSEDAQATGDAPDVCRTATCGPSSPSRSTQRPPAADAAAQPPRRPYTHFLPAATVPASVASRLAVEVASLASTVFGPLHTAHELCVKHLIEACACACGEIAADINAASAAVGAGAGAGADAGVGSAAVELGSPRSSAPGSVAGGTGVILRAAELYASGVRGMWGDVRMGGEREYGLPAHTPARGSNSQGVLSNGPNGYGVLHAAGTGVGVTGRGKGTSRSRTGSPRLDRVPTHAAAPATALAGGSSGVSGSGSVGSAEGTGGGTSGVGGPADDSTTTTSSLSSVVPASTSTSTSVSTSASTSAATRAQLLETNLALIFRCYQQERARIYAAEDAYRLQLQQQRKRLLNAQALREHAALQEREERVRAALYCDRRRVKAAEEREKGAGAGVGAGDDEPENTPTATTTASTTTTAPGAVPSVLPALSPYRGAIAPPRTSSSSGGPRPTSSSVTRGRSDTTAPTFAATGTTNGVSAAAGPKSAPARVGDTRRREEKDVEEDGIVQWQARACAEAQELVDYWSLMGPWDFHFPSGNV